MNTHRIQRLLTRSDRHQVVIDQAPYPCTLRIEDHAREKMKEICRLVRDKHGSREWYGFLAARRDCLQTISEVILEEHEDASPSHTSVAAESVAKAASHASALGCRIVGWVHSHARFGVFFSPPDKRNILTVLNSVYLNTRALVAREELADEVTVVDDPAKAAAAGLCLVLEQAGAGPRPTFRLLAPVYTGWSYNVVVNEQAELLAEAAVLEQSPWTGRRRLFRKRLELDIVPTDRQIDMEALGREVEQKIRPQPKWTGWGAPYRGQTKPGWGFTDDDELTLEPLVESADAPHEIDRFINLLRDAAMCRSGNRCPLPFDCSAVLDEIAEATGIPAASICGRLPGDRERVQDLLRSEARLRALVEDVSAPGLSEEAFKSAVDRYRYGKD